MGLYDSLDMALSPDNLDCTFVLPGTRGTDGSAESGLTLVCISLVHCSFIISIIA